MTDEELAAIEARIGKRGHAAMRDGVEVFLQGCAGCEVYTHDESPWTIGCTDDIRTLLAEVKRNRCPACLHAFADHKLYDGTSYITCLVCNSECDHEDRWDA